MTVVVLLFATAAALTVGPAPSQGLRRLHAAPPLRGRRTARLSLLLAPALAVTALMGPRMAGWLMAGGVMAATAVWVLTGMTAERRRKRQRAETARAVQTVALLLQAGQIPTRALEDAASDCSLLAPAALTGQLGGDVAAALRETGAAPGRGGLSRMAAAWFVSERTGAPIVSVLARVAETMRQERHLAGVVASELSAARASGRIMALLPFVAIGIGILVGADPLSFLFGSAFGEVAFLAGTCLAAAGVIWTERISRSGARGGGRG